MILYVLKCLLTEIYLQIVITTTKPITKLHKLIYFLFLYLYNSIYFYNELLFNLSSTFETIFLFFSGR